MPLHQWVATFSHDGEVLPGKRAGLFRRQRPYFADHHPAASAVGVPILDDKGPSSTRLHANAEPAQFGVPTEELLRWIGAKTIDEALGDLRHENDPNCLPGRGCLPRSALGKQVSESIGNLR